MTEIAGERKQTGTVLVVCEKAEDGKSMSVFVSDKATVKDLNMIMESIGEHIKGSGKSPIQ